MRVIEFDLTTALDQDTMRTFAEGFNQALMSVYLKNSRTQNALDAEYSAELDVGVEAMAYQAYEYGIPVLIECAKRLKTTSTNKSHRIADNYDSS